MSSIGQATLWAVIVTESPSAARRAEKSNGVVE
jgi:hypothetical protein